MGGCRVGFPCPAARVAAGSRLPPPLCVLGPAAAWRCQGSQAPARRDTEVSQAPEAPHARDGAWTRLGELLERGGGQG